MEVQLLVYIRRYRKHFTSDLGQTVIIFNWRVFEFFELLNCLRKKCFGKLDLGIILIRKRKNPDFNTFKERHQL